MKIENCFNLGYIANTHGIKGELKVYFDTDDPEWYEDLERFYILQKDKLNVYVIQQIRFQPDKKLFIVKLEQINSLEEAATLKGCSLYLPDDMLPDLSEHQFYYHEVIGFQIVDEQLGPLGIIKQIYESGDHNLIAMSYQNKEVLIPLQDEIIKKVNREQKTLDVQLPDGLLNIYLD